MQKTNKVEIFEPPSDRRYWVVKADAGRLYEIFIENSLISIGHLNQFLDITTEVFPYVIATHDIKKLMTEVKNDKFYCNSNNFGQVNSFINDMKVGDWVITKGEGVVSIGRVESEPRIDNKSESIVINKNSIYEKIVEMDYKLKRDICWGAEIKIEYLPTDIFLSLKTPMTLYNVDRYLESICHTLYPYFKIENNLHFTIRINQEKEISNFYIAKIFDYLNELEFLSKTDFTEDETDLESFYEAFAINGCFNLSTQASFHSPGDIWANLKFEKLKVSQQMMKAVLIYSMLFGHSYLGFDGILDLVSMANNFDPLADINIDPIKAKKMLMFFASIDNSRLLT